MDTCPVRGKPMRGHVTVVWLAQGVVFGLNPRQLPRRVVTMSGRGKPLRTLGTTLRGMLMTHPLATDKT